MRAALLVSATLHLAVIAAAFVTLKTESYSTAPVAALPVELVTIAEETDLTVGDVEAEELVEEADERTVEAEAAPEPDAQPGATDEPAETVATNEEAVDAASPATAPEPAGEPLPQEPQPEAEDTAETEVAALPEPAEPEPEPEPDPEPEQAAPPVPETVVPAQKPEPPRRTRTARVERPSSETFDADRLSQLINRTDPTGGGAGSATASIGTEEGRPGAALTMNWQDSLKAQVQRCWNLPVGLATEDELVITVGVTFQQDGSVIAIEETQVEGIGALYDVAADAARRAVLRCQPYDLPASEYESWKEVAVEFDPEDIL